MDGPPLLQDFPRVRISIHIIQTRRHECCPRAFEYFELLSHEERIHLVKGDYTIMEPTYHSRGQIGDVVVCWDADDMHINSQQGRM